MHSNHPGGFEYSEIAEPNCRLMRRDAKVSSLNIFSSLLNRWFPPPPPLSPLVRLRHTPRWLVTLLSYTWVRTVTLFGRYSLNSIPVGYQSKRSFSPKFIRTIPLVCIKPSDRLSCACFHISTQKVRQWSYFLFFCRGDDSLASLWFTGKLLWEEIFRKDSHHGFLDDRVYHVQLWKRTALYSWLIRSRKFLFIWVTLVIACGFCCESTKGAVRGFDPE